MLKKYLSTIFLLSCFPLAFVHAETHITDGYLYEGGMWTAAGSPYILEDYVTIPLGQKLIIKEGVDVLVASTSDPLNPYSIEGAGDIEITGTQYKPVHITRLGDLFLKGTASIRNTIFDGTGLFLLNATTTLDSVKITGAAIAISAKKSRITITNSEIVGNGSGVVSNIWSTGGVFQVFSDNDNALGGIGNALGDDPNQNIITIHSTVFEKNTGYSIRNRTANSIDATDNWWESADGPGLNTSGAVVADPWLLSDPRLVASKPACCSSVFFLPGFMASRLYNEEPNIIGTGLPGGTRTKQLWEPLFNEDMRKLSMDSQGSSTDATIRPVGIIDTALGVQNIYSKFIAMMDGMVADKTINVWKPFSYDWRKAVSDVVNNAVEEVEQLAEFSQTGKVSIIAHSNGGLVAKMLGRELEKKGKAYLLDRVMFVAVPQLGTPQAIAGMLHGDGQELGKGLIISASTARTFGLNIPGAYGLLPSRDFFSRVTDPIVRLVGKAIGSYKGLTDFLTGVSDGRLQPAATDLEKPAVLNSGLLAKSQWMHDVLDSWNFPTTTSVASIVGWGSPTTNTIKYDASSTVFTKIADGDGTVLTQSAASYIAPTFYFNQGLYNKDTRKNISHADILESESIRTMLKDTLASNSAAALPAYISSVKPTIADYPWMNSWLTVSVHSPVDIDLYSSRGGHMGIIPIPGHEDADVKMFDNTIGGSYDAIGDEKYITVPADDTYTVQLKGTGSGTFTLKVDKLDANMKEVASTTYTDLPVTPLLLASTIINATTSALAAPLSLDVDGNGISDIQAASSSVMNPAIHLESMKLIIQSLKLKPAQEKNLLNKIERIKTLLTKDKNAKAIKKIKKMMQQQENKHINLKKMTESERQNIVSMFTSLLDTLEKD